MIHPPELSGKHQQTHKAKQGETWREMSMNFADEVSLSNSHTIIHAVKNIYRHEADGFNPPPPHTHTHKGSRAMDYGLKYPSSSAGFKHANLKFNGKHDNQHTAENNQDG
jgi:hypothetical protein